MLKVSLIYFSCCSDQTSSKASSERKGLFGSRFEVLQSIMLGKSWWQVAVVGVVWLLICILADQNSQSRKGRWYCGRDSSTISKTISRTTPLRESQVFWDLKVSLYFLPLNGGNTMIWAIKWKHVASKWEKFILPLETGRGLLSVTHVIIEHQACTAFLDRLETCT